MKKMIILCIFVITICRACSSDSATDNSSVAESDTVVVQEEKDERNPFLYYEMCESNDAYYGVVKNPGENGLIMYYDKTSGGNGILCGKPECTHDNLDCNARVDGGVRGFCIYENQIYWVGRELTENGIGQNYLWRMQLDGTQREKVQSIELRVSGNNVQNPEFLLYKGNLYYICGEYKVKDAAAEYWLRVYTVPIGSEARFVSIFEEQMIAEYFRMQVVDDQLYVMATTADYDENGDPKKKGIYLYQWNIEEQKLISLVENTDCDFLGNMMWVEKDGIYISERTFLQDTFYPGLYKYDFEEKKIVKCFSGEEGATFGVSGGMTEVADGVVVNRTQNSESKITTVYIRDFNGQLLCKREVIFEGMKEGTQYGKAFLGGNQNSVFLKYNSIRSQDKDFYFIVEVPLDINEECKVLWYAEWDKSMVG